MLKLIKNAYVYAPEEIGIVDILIAGDKIAWIEKEMNVLVPEIEVYDAKGLIAIPGLIDPHVHITGGGGEGGFSTRTPELKISDCVKNGVTTVIGCLGTDGITRSLENLYAKAKALEIEGLTSYIYTGSYRVPPVTFTGSIQKDLVLIDKVIGTGEIAISDHRSSQPTFEEILRIVSDTRVGGMISGKPGIVNFHIGDGERGIEWLFEIVQNTEIPVKHLYPTHMSRNKKLFEHGLEFTKVGGYIDLTALQPTEDINDFDFSTIDAIMLAYDNKLLDKITISSDGQGSLPKFDKDRNFVGLDVGSVDALLYTIKSIVKRGVKFEDAIKLSTTNPAKVLDLKTKGKISNGFDADIVFLKDWKVISVLSRGEFLMRHGGIKKFNFE
uniref:Isoaspartyl dipeptidase n=1 Tax=Fervidobacterium nodosum TaxID=2424 RepID=A0A7C5Y2T5_9BACT